MTIASNALAGFTRRKVMRKLTCLAFAISMVAGFTNLQAALAGEGEVAEPPDYRMDHFRAPVPATLKGATVVDTQGAHAIWQAGKTVFIDVLPQAPKPPSLPEGVIWRDKPRDTIKGAVWLPNVGYGKLHPDMHSFFKQQLATLTGNDTSKPVLFFCLQDCWMSWNAAKRALEYGYTDVSWFPDGTDGWSFQDHPLETVKPMFPPAKD